MLPVQETITTHCQKAVDHLLLSLRSPSHDKQEEKNVEAFREALARLLHEKVSDHWYPLEPERGQAYRSISRCGSIHDKLLIRACHAAHLTALETDLFLEKLHQDFTLFIDPGCVAMRMGSATYTLWPSPSSKIGTLPARESKAIAIVAPSEFSSRTPSPQARPPSVLSQTSESDSTPQTISDLSHSSGSEAEHDRPLDPRSQSFVPRHRRAPMKRHDSIVSTTSSLGSIFLGSISHTLDTTYTYDPSLEYPIMVGPNGHLIDLRKTRSRRRRGQGGRKRSVDISAQTISV